MEESVGYNLSPQQRRFWRLRRRGDELFAQTALLIEGALDEDLLLRAVRRVVNRDAIFRTAYVRPANAELPVQVVGDEAAVECSTERLDSLDGLDALAEQARQRFLGAQDTSALHVTLCALPGARYALLLTTSPLCADLWSLGVLAAEISECYQALAGGPDEYEPDSLPYLQFSEWQNQLSKSEEAEEGRDYWRARRAATPGAPFLPFDLDQTHVETFRPAFYGFRLGAGELADIEGAFGGSGFTAEHVLALAWLVLLWRLVNGQPLTIGHVNSYRDFEELHRTLGLLSRCLPLDVPLAGRSSFVECLHTYRGLLEECDEQKAFLSPDESLMPGGAPDSLPYAFECVPDAGRPEAGGVVFTPLLRRSLAERHKLKLSCTVSADGVACEFQYQEGGFDREGLEFLAGALRAVVAQGCADPSCALDDLRLLDEYHVRRLLHTFTETAVEFGDGDKTVAELFRQQAGLHPEHAAVICAGRSLSYRELDEESDSLAAHLRDELKVGAGDFVGLMCGESERLVIGMLAVIKAGGAYVPLDPSIPAERVRLILEDSGTQTVLTETQFRAQLGDYGGRVLLLDVRELKRGGGAPPAAPRTPDDTAYVIYTSGTTGRPKGTLLRDRSLVNYVCWLRHAFSLSPADSSVLLSSYAFDLGYTSLWGTLLNGGSLHLVDSGALREPESLVDYIAGQRISFIKVTPSLLRLLLDAANAGALRADTLRLVLVGGERIRVGDLERLHALNPAATLVNHYGPTETCIGVVAQRIDAARLSRYAVHPVIGRPVANNAVYVLERDDRLAAPGLAGELCVSGVGLAKGYLNREELTREKFVDNPFAPGKKMYRTGDLAAWLPDGTLLYLGRKDDQIKIRGYRVEPMEIEAALCGHPSALSAAVVASQDATDEQHLLAYVVFQEGAEPSAGELRGHLEALLPEYAIPAHFIGVASLPLTPNGKLDRARLPRVDSPGAHILKGGSPHVAPRDEVESSLVEAWQAVLRVERVGIHDDFFALGGDSIKAIRIASRLRQEKLDFKVGDVFQFPTVASLAPHVERLGAPSTQGPATGLAPLTPFQQELISSVAPAHLGRLNRAVVLRLARRLDGAAVEAVFSKIAEHHDALRARLSRDPLGLLIEDAGAPPPLEEFDLRESADPAREMAERSAALRASIDAERGPLTRLALFHLPDGDYQLLVVHHLLADDTSWRILLADADRLYQQRAQGAPLALPDKTDAFKAWAERLREESRPGTATAGMEYRPEARGLLDGTPGGERDGAGGDASREARASFTLPEAETARLLTDANRAFNTKPSDLLLTALGLAVRRDSGRAEVALTLRDDGRETAFKNLDTSRTLGCFTFTHTLAFDLSFAGDLSRCIKEVKECLRKMPNVGGSHSLPESSPGDGREGESGGTPQIGFSYSTRPAGEGAFVSFSVIEEAAGGAPATRHARLSELEVSATAAGDILTVSVAFDEERHARGEIEALLERYRATLLEVIDHCCGRETTESTPSDFSYKGLSVEAMDNLFDV